MSWIDVRLIAESYVSLVKAQTYQALSSHGAGLRVDKSEGSMAEPDTCLTEA